MKLSKILSAEYRFQNGSCPNITKKKYGIPNLWKFNLPNGWRLLYSIANDEIIVVSIILDWLDHKDYEKRMNY
jgi:hypothetical protein